ncbi:MAG: hypothetical protein ACRBN8_30160 [Nannocystales bacterium]
MRSPVKFFAPTAFLALVWIAAPTAAEAADEAGPQIRRKGGQWSLLAGGSACLPGRASCSRESTLSGTTVDGTTRPSLATGAELGYRINDYVFVGAAYRFGMFDMSFVNPDGLPYEFAYQHSIYGVVRPSIPLWRFDLGLSLGSGFSRQVFRLPGDDRDYSAGFSALLGPTLDLFISDRVFLGARFDLLLNAQGDVCQQRGGETRCGPAQDTDAGPVHQMVLGLNVGGTFL